jgi:hypothetical protein
MNWLVLLSAVLIQQVDVPTGPVDVGGRAQLFIDRHLVHQATGVSFTLHPAQKHPANPLIRSGSPAARPVYLCGSVLYDGDENLFKMWYLGCNGELYATSRDGLKWEDSKTCWKGFMFAAVWKDRDDPAPARRYKIIAWGPNAKGVKNTGYDPPIDTGYNTYVSPDGQRVTIHSQKPICPHGDVIGGYYDRRLRLYVAFPKIMTHVRGFRRRCFYVTTSEDFESWSPPKPAFVPDHRDDDGAAARIEEARPILDVPEAPAYRRTEFYGVGVYQAESCTVAFPWLFTISGPRHPGPQEGPGEVQLAVSRDLEHWERPFRTPAISRGKPGQWDCGFFETAAEAFRFGDEIRLYFSCTNHGHGHRKRPGGPASDHAYGIGLATWRLDRFVSADAPASGGVLTTVPLVFDGRRLELNARTRPGGKIRVTLCDIAGSPLPGWPASEAVCGDSLRLTVAFGGLSDLGTLARRPVTLRFELVDAELFSFAFR